MEILVLCGIYLVELVCYRLGLKILFNVRLKTWKWIAIGILFPVIMGTIPLDNATGKNMLVTIAVVGVMFVSVEGRVIEKVILLVLSFLLMECINAFFVFLCGMILVEGDEANVISINYLVVKCCTAVGFFLFSMVKERLVQYNKAHINSMIYFIIGLIAISMLFCLMFLNQVVNYIHNSRHVFFCNILDVAIFISIFFLAIFVVYIKNTHERMEQLLKTEQILKESQMNYYKQALRKEMDTRKYRHDMVNHLVCVQNKLSKGNNDEAEKYLDSILGGFKKIQNTNYIIGNDTIDAIMNYFFDMLPDGVSIDIRGKCLVRIEIEEIDICTIFSNLLQNVVEEIVENNILDAHIIIAVQKGKQYVEYRIQNTLLSEVEENIGHKNKLPRSHKKDKRNHGIGMMNVKSTVERNKGRFEWYIKDGYFCVKVILPIRDN